MKRFLLLLILCLYISGASALPIGGSVRCGHKPIEGVLVTDGYNFAKTDNAGVFELEADERAPFIYMVIPAGYTAPLSGSIPQFYLPLSKGQTTYDFRLVETSRNSPPRVLAVGDVQPKTSKHLARLKSEIMPPLRKIVREGKSSGQEQIAILLGDVVWDALDNYDAVKKQFAGLGIPVYPVIGNHDHDLKVNSDFESAETYRRALGPTYYAFDFGSTHYIVLDDIIYYGAKKYDEQIDAQQLEWVGRYLEHVPAGSRVCVAMHAPVFKYWHNKVMESALPLIEILKEYELHFITGHTHINSNCEVAEGVIEHNVAQICSNLWHDKINRDGTPAGVQIFTDDNGAFSWQYRCLNQPADYQMKIWGLGAVPGHEDRVVVKVWNWDAAWTVTCSEDGRPAKAMERFSMPDPDYVAYVESQRKEGMTISSARTPRPAPFYFGVTPSPGTREITIEAIDRFGNRFSRTISPASLPAKD